MPVPSRPNVDPYLLWGQDTNFAGFKVPPIVLKNQRLIPVAVELKIAADNPQARALMYSVPPSYPTTSCFFTGLLDETHLPALKLLALRIKMGLPSTPTGKPGTIIPPLGGVAPKRVIGIIDNGFGFLNQTFCSSATSTRFLALWDQEDTGTGTVTLPWIDSPFQYGRQIGSAVIDACLARLQGGESEDAIYASLAYQPARRRAAHGTHVLDLAAGALDPTTRKKRQDPVSDITSLIGVQLPYKPFKDTSGSSFAVHILDGLRYIVGHLNGRQEIAIVNISDGAYAGSHDGNSLLERAIDALIDDSGLTAEGLPRLTVVIAAGNGYRQRLHARWQETVPAMPNVKPELHLRLLPDVLTDTFVEIWCTPQQGPAQTVPVVAVTSPDGNSWSCAVTTSTPFGNAASPFGGIYGSDNLALNGSGRYSFLIALSTTIVGVGITSRPHAKHGIWKISVQGVSEFDAYIQRNNPALGDDGPNRQSYFVDDRLQPKYVTGKSTLNNVATGQGVIVVGGYYRRGTFFDSSTGNHWQVTNYSSKGPGRKGSIPGVNMHAPSEDSPVLHGVLASGVRNGTVMRMDGTSVAAPQVTRFIANSYMGYSTPNPELKPPGIDNRP